MLMFLALLSFTPAADPPEAVVRLELLAAKNLPLTAGQRWARRLARQDVRVTVRSPRPSDEIGVSETTKGRLRFVVVTAALGPDGDLKMPGRTMSLSEPAAVDKWIAGLKAYGAAGPPDASDGAGDAGWGLTPAGWAAVCDAAARPTPPTADNPSVATVLKRLSEATGLPVRTESLDDRLLLATCAAPDRRLTVGVACAIALRRGGVGFAPRRTPGGATEWVAKPAGDGLGVWPAGWAVKPGLGRGPVAGATFRRGEIAPSATLGELLDNVSRDTGVPHVPFSGELDSDAPGWASTPVAVRAVGVPVMEVTRSLRQRRMTLQYKWDDAGRGFVVVRPFKGTVTAPPRSVRPPAVLAVEASAGN